MTLQKLSTKIETKKAIIGIIGLGYVGLPLALLFTKNKFKVIGFVKTKKRQIELSSGISQIGVDKELKKALKINKFIVETINNINDQDCDVYIVCVPTPIDDNKQPDLSSLNQVIKSLSKLDLENKLIINESTVAPYTTRYSFGQLGNNFFLVSSPERIDPGGSRPLEQIPKVIGGINQESLSAAVALYSKILKKKIIPVASLEIAEMAKMMENTYRAVNIALINEFAKLADSINIDILAVITASKSKWSFHPHYPGIGVGGHCIPVDPYYLLELADKNASGMIVVKDALKVNESMPEYIYEKIKLEYKPGCKLLIYGLTYKKEVSDLRESPVLKVCKKLIDNDIAPLVYDPMLTETQIQKLGLKIGKLEEVDILVVGTDHDQLSKDADILIGENTTIIDGRNYFHTKKGKKIIGVGRKLI